MNQLDSSESDIMKELEASRFFTRCVMYSIFRPYSKTVKDQVSNLFNTYKEDVILKGKNIISCILSSDNSKVHVVNIYLDHMCLLLPFAASDDNMIKQFIEKVTFTVFKSILFCISLDICLV